jgi:hypothetical protein
MFGDNPPAANARGVSHAQIIRRILADHARNGRYAKRGGGAM